MAKTALVASVRPLYTIIPWNDRAILWISRVVPLRRSTGSRGHPRPPPPTTEQIRPPRRGTERKKCWKRKSLLIEREGIAKTVPGRAQGLWGIV